MTAPTPRLDLPRVAALLLVAAVVLIVLLTLPGLLKPTSPLEINTDVGSIVAIPGGVTLPGQCVTLTWNLQRIEMVWLDGVSVEASGSQQVCPNYGYQPTLWFLLDDGSVRDYPVDVSTLVWNPDVWFALLTVVALLLFASALDGRLAGLLRRVAAIGLVLLGTGLLASYGYLLFTSARDLPQAPLLVTEHSGDLEVRMSLSSAWVKFPGDSAILSWEVAAERAYIKEELIPPAGSQSVSVTPGYIAGLWAKPVDGPGHSYYLHPEILFWNSKTFGLLLLGVLGCVFGAALLSKRIGDSLRRWLAIGPPPMPAGELAPSLGRWMGWTLALLTAPFLLAASTTIASEGLWPALLYVTLSSGLAVWALSPATQAWMARQIARRAMVFAPVVWLAATIVMLDVGMSLVGHPLFWSALQVWNASIFCWLGFFWLVAYVQRTFSFDDVHRARAWAAIALLTLAVFAIMLVVIFVMKVPAPAETDWTGVPLDEPPFVRSGIALNSDSILYLPYTLDFPYSWREPYTNPEFVADHSYDQLIIHRPTYFAMTSQVCQIADVVGAGYVSGNRACSSSTMALVASQITNVLMTIASAIVLYELGRFYLKSAAAALVGALLSITSLANVWTLPNPSTDHAEILILAVSLWLFHRLLSDDEPSTQKVISIGVLFGLLLLMKLNVTYLLFGGVLILYLRRWRLLGIYALVGVVWLLYGWLIPLMGIPYAVAELNTIPSLNDYTWHRLYQNLPESIAFVEWLSYVRAAFGMVSEALGTATNRMLEFHGALLPLGLLGISLHERFPRSLRGMFWAMFWSVAAWHFIVPWRYVRHTMGVMPFLYGAVALAALSAPDEWASKLKLPIPQRAVTPLLVGLAFANNIVLLVIMRNAR